MNEPLGCLALIPNESFIHKFYRIIANKEKILIDQCGVILHPHSFNKPKPKMKSSVQLVSDSLQPHGLKKARLPCPSPTPRACTNSCPSNRSCHPTISSSVIPVSSFLQSFPATGSLPRSQFLASDGQSTGASASASVLPMNSQDWFPLGLSGLISLQSRGLSRVFSNTTV